MGDLTNMQFINYLKKRRKQRSKDIRLIKFNQVIHGIEGGKFVLFRMTKTDAIHFTKLIQSKIMWSSERNNPVFGFSKLL